MNSLFQKFKPDLLMGGLMTIVITIVLIQIGFIITHPGTSSTLGFVFINIFSFLIFWMFFSFIIHKFNVYRVLAVVAFIAVVLTIGRYKGIFAHPMTFPLLILFWLAIAHFVFPNFHKKYRVIAFLSYGFILVSYLLFFNMGPDGADYYRLNFINSLFIPIPVFVGLWLYEQWRWLKTLKADKAKAELALLKSQVNPHFFFNTLNNLYGLVVEKSEDAPEVVLKLSDMMRYTIYEGKEDLVNLTDEIKYLETYIGLHKIRYQQRVDIRFKHDVKNEIQIAPLLFIILLENAFKHGAEKLTEKAYISLDLVTRDDQIFFTIENNYESNPSRKKGIGLDNLKQRLTHIYPNRHELKVEQTDSTYTAHLNLDLR